MKTLKMFLIPLLLLAYGGQAHAATLYGAEYTKTRAVPQQLVTQGTDGGRIKHCFDSYALTADLAVNDVILGCRIPSGARVVDARLYYDALSAGTVSVGWAAGAAAVEAADSTGLFANIAVTSAGVKSLFTDNRTGTGFMKTFSEEVRTRIQTVVDTSATSGNIGLEVFYTVD